MSTDLHETPLPGVMVVRDVLQGTLGREVTVATGGPMVDPGTGGGALVGVYVDRFLKLSALMLFDFPLAARAGAAIGLTPPVGADIAIEERDLPDSLLENASEIFSIAISFFNTGGARHLSLDRCYAPGEALPNDIAKWIFAHIRRVDLKVTIKGYGDGHLSVLVI